MHLYIYKQSRLYGMYVYGLYIDCRNGVVRRYMHENSAGQWGRTLIICGIEKYRVVKRNTRL